MHGLCEHHYSSGSAKITERLVQWRVQLVESPHASGDALLVPTPNSERIFDNHLSAGVTSVCSSLVADLAWTFDVHEVSRASLRHVGAAVPLDVF
mmetsp:Transcript_30742/g.81718  ORF Transcript_30742/g.81718 Transcript_30742/m.81718 type:complete len:95 (-) Transcript_30742:259-543(-)